MLSCFHHLLPSFKTCEQTWSHTKAQSKLKAHLTCLKNIDLNSLCCNKSFKLEVPSSKATNIHLHESVVNVSFGSIKLGPLIPFLK